MTKKVFMPESEKFKAHQKRHNELRLAIGLDGGVVMLGKRTREFGKKKFSEWLEFLHSTAIDRGVKVYAE